MNNYNEFSIPSCYVERCFNQPETMRSFLYGIIDVLDKQYKFPMDVSTNLKYYVLQSDKSTLILIFHYILSMEPHIYNRICVFSLIDMKRDTLSFRELCHKYELYREFCIEVMIELKHSPFNKNNARTILNECIRKLYTTWKRNRYKTMKNYKSSVTRLANKNKSQHKRRSTSNSLSSMTKKSFTVNEMDIIDTEQIEEPIQGEVIQTINISKPTIKS